MTNELIALYKGMALKQRAIEDALGGVFSLFDEEYDRLFCLICESIGAHPGDYAFDKLDDYINGRISLAECIEDIKAVEVRD
ncbi:hypothetical protein [Paenibacillus urinalis]|uniref:hypothetical protein n=1 Tax=Paenibacillus urinalis TaxID=521520 RepID=UPI0019613CFF